MANPNEPLHILPITDDELLIELIETAIQSDDSYALIDPSLLTDEVLEDIATLRPNYLLLDYKNGYSDSLNLIDSVSSQFPDIVIIAIVDEDHVGDAQQIILSGARAFLVQPIAQTNLLNTLNRVTTLITRTQSASLTTAEPDTPLGARGTFTVFSPKGGVGCSSVAANLGLALFEKLKEEVLLIDGKLLFGHLDIMLNLRTQNSIADLVAHVGALDESLIRDVVSEHVSGLKVLTSPTTVSAGQGVRPDDLFNIISSIQPLYNNIVVDAGNFLNENTVTYMDASYKIILVISPDITSLRDASQFFDISRSLAYPSDKILVVVNRFDKRDGLSLSDIEKSLQVKVFGTIPWERKDSLQSVNRGIPAVLHRQNSNLGRAYSKLAADLITLKKGAPVKA
jgi:pilus assembly protein CpaE